MRKILLALATFSLTAFPALGDHTGPQIKNAYARVMGATAKSGAIFLDIENHGAADALVAVASDAAERTELHTHKQDANGVMQMLKMEEALPIPAHGGHALARGGDHIMLLGLTKTLKQGDVITLTLTFEQAGDVVVEVPVDNERKAEAAMDHMGHQGHSMAGDGQPMTDHHQHGNN